METITEERTYALNIYLEKQLSVQFAQNQVNRCQQVGKCLWSNHSVVTAKGAEALGVGIAACRG